MVYFLGVTGGSGAGKSTVSYHLVDENPSKVVMIHFDDYQKANDEVPVHFGMRDFDHPDTIDWVLLLNDLEKLKQGKEITINTWASRENTDYSKGRIDIKVKPTDVVIIEGYMALYDERVRNYLDASVYLDLDHETRVKRRDKFINPEYEKKILVPAQKKYVEPAKQIASLVIDVSHMKPSDIAEKIKREFLANIL